MVRAALALRAAGVAFGRNIFEAADPTREVEKLVTLVHLQND
jgi:DhnA family fructose-bisphosphate aldolase class Ia